MNVAKLTLSFFMAATMTACSVSKKQHSYDAAYDAARVSHSADSVAVSYLRSIVLEKPCVEIIRRTPTDTFSVIYRAEKVVVADCTKVDVTAQTADSIRSYAVISETDNTEHTRLQSEQPFILKVLTVLLLPILIVLSWRGIRSRQ